MSKPKRTLRLFLLALPLILHSFNNTRGQEVKIDITIGPSGKATAQVTGRNVVPNSRNLSFVQNVGGVGNLASRISGLDLSGKNGSSIDFKKFIDGEFVADAPISGWRYAVDLTPAKLPAAAAHASWIAGDKGLLMLDDLVPRAAGSNSAVSIKVPDGWAMFAPGGNKSGKAAVESDPRRTVIPIGRGWRELEIDAGGSHLKLVISGEWLFSDSDVASVAGEVFREYKRIFGAGPPAAVQVVIANFPSGAAPGLWEAETRGETVTIISGDMNFKTQSLQRLHEQLRHEMFHLWLPNGVSLRGDYDWFYEGFALYQSLRTAVSLNRIRFEDFLDTLSRAYDIDTSQTTRRSLTAASADRWSGGDTQVYARGMIVAFLCDVAMLDRSGGKLGVEDIEREIYGSHRTPSPPADANESVIAVLRKHSELSPLVDKYVNGSDAMDWTAYLHLASIEPVGEGRHIILKVVEKPRGRQKTVLDKLGYNSWRKLAGSSK